MRFEDQVVFGVEDVAQLDGGTAVVIDDVEVIELDAGLHHQRDDARPHVIQTYLGEGRTVGGNRSPGPVRRCRGETTQRLERATRYRNLGADDVHRAVSATAAGGVLGHLQQPCTAARHDVVGKDGRVVRARHAAVQVDFGVSRLDI